MIRSVTGAVLNRWQERLLASPHRTKKAQPEPHSEHPPSTILSLACKAQISRQSGSSPLLKQVRRRQDRGTFPRPVGRLR
jgi:hypothetical protein